MSLYSIWVVEYARVAAFPQSAALYGAHNGGVRNLPFCYVVIKGDGLVAMIDAGHNHVGYAKSFAETIGVSDWHPPEVVLGEIGLTPQDVSHLIITHAHFDHMGGVGLFPNATLYVQQRELTEWVAIMALGRRFRSLMGGIDPGDIINLVDLARSGRLVTIEGRREDILPGIDLVPAFDTHTPGSQYVLVRNEGALDREPWIIAGDLVYGYDNLTGGDELDPCYIPVGLATGSQTNLVRTSHELLQSAGGDIRRIIPVHEERLKEVFPSRQAETGLWISEIALRAGETSRVR